MNRNRFLVKSYGDNVDGTRAGIIKLLELAGVHKSSVIVVPTFNHLKATMLTSVLGDKLSADLIKHRKIVIENGNTIELCSETTLKNFQRANLYLALWGSPDMVEKIEALRVWNSHIVVTWLPMDAEKWIGDHDVQIIYDDGKK